MRLRAAALGLVVGACSQRDPIASCGADLHGVWVTPAGAHWMALDNGPTLELFPLFDDGVADGAPRVIDLKRDLGRDGGLEGELKRRFMRREQACEARAPVHVMACKDDSLQFVIGEVAGPLAYAPCTWPQQAPTRVEVWRRD